MDYAYSHRKMSTRAHVVRAGLNHGICRAVPGTRSASVAQVSVVLPGAVCRYCSDYSTAVRTSSRMFPYLEVLILYAWLLLLHDDLLRLGSHPIDQKCWKRLQAMMPVCELGWQSRSLMAKWQPADTPRYEMHYGKCVGVVVDLEGLCGETAPKLRNAKARKEMTRSLFATNAPAPSQH